MLLETEPVQARAGRSGLASAAGAARFLLPASRSPAPDREGHPLTTCSSVCRRATSRCHHHL